MHRGYACTAAMHLVGKGDDSLPPSPSRPTRQHGDPRVSPRAVTMHARRPATTNCRDARQPGARVPSATLPSPCAGGGAAPARRDCERGAPRLATSPHPSQATRAARQTRSRRLFLGTQGDGDGRSTRMCRPVPNGERSPRQETSVCCVLWRSHVKRVTSLSMVPPGGSRLCSGWWLATA